MASRRGSKSRVVGRGFSRAGRRRLMRSISASLKSCRRRGGACKKGPTLLSAPGCRTSIGSAQPARGRAGRSGFGGSRFGTARAPGRRSVTGAGRLHPREDTAFPASAASSKCEQARVSRFGRFLPAGAASHKERRRHRVDHGPSHCPGCEQPRRHDIFGLPLSRSFLASDRLRSLRRRPIA